MTSLGYTSAGTATFTPATDTLIVHEGGGTYTQTLSGTYTGDAFLLSSDGVGGTVMSVTQQNIGPGVTSFIDGTTGTGTISAAGSGTEFIFTSSVAGGHVIAGFDPSSDLINLSLAHFGSFAGVMADTSTVGGAAVIQLGTANTLTLQNVLPGQLTSANFNLG